MTRFRVRSLRAHGFDAPAALPAATRFHRPRSRRGAVMIEAIVVINFFILCFLGIGYFRSLYVQKLQVQRLARSAALAHAMGACQDDPRTSIALDTGSRRVTESLGSGVPFDAIPSIPNLPGSEKGTNALETIRAKNGDTGLDKVTTVTLTGDASMTTRASATAPEGGFRGVAASTSYVMCGDPLPDDRYEGMVAQIAKLF